MKKQQLTTIEFVFAFSTVGLTVTDLRTWNALAIVALEFAVTATNKLLFYFFNLHTLI